MKTSKVYSSDLHGDPIPIFKYDASTHIESLNQRSLLDGEGAHFQGFSVILYALNSYDGFHLINFSTSILSGSDQYFPFVTHTLNELKKELNYRIGYNFTQKLDEVGDTNAMLERSTCAILDLNLKYLYSGLEEDEKKYCRVMSDALLGYYYNCKYNELYSRYYQITDDAWSMLENILRSSSSPLVAFNKGELDERYVSHLCKHTNLRFGYSDEDCECPYLISVFTAETFLMHDRCSEIKVIIKENVTKLIERNLEKFQGISNSGLEH